MTSGRPSRVAAWLVVGLCVMLIVATVVLQVVGPRAVAGHQPAGLTGPASWILVLAYLAYAVVGALIVSRAPGNGIGPLFLGSGLLGLLGELSYQYADQGLHASSGVLPGAAEAAVLQNVASPPTIGALGLALLLFPDGRLPTRRLRCAGGLALLGMASIMIGYAVQPGPIEFFRGTRNPWGVASLDMVAGALVLIGWALMPLGVLLGGAATVRRFRRSTGLARQQLKWVAFAGAVAGVLFLANLASWLVDLSSIDGLRDALLCVAMASFPAAVGIAILRYRLYDIDVFVNRALVYGSLTVLLAASYIGGVLVLQLALRPLTRSSDLAVAGSTLAVAALFRPARERIRGLVDRRFYRSRYDATRTLAQFTAHLRDQLDADALADDICRVVEDTVQPTHVTLWVATAERGAQ
ncbi:MAG TPA: hypothetical protein VER39_08920 [Nocardioidaceae bacterium]|nr:hypothetical protein [Nocardioidaceae bacterium]